MDDLVTSLLSRQTYKKQPHITLKDTFMNIKNMLLASIFMAASLSYGINVDDFYKLRNDLYQLQYFGQTSDKVRIELPKPIERECYSPREKTVWIYLREGLGFFCHPEITLCILQKDRAATLNTLRKDYTYLTTTFLITCCTQHVEAWKIDSPDLLERAHKHFYDHASPALKTFYEKMRSLYESSIEDIEKDPAWGLDASKPAIATPYFPGAGSDA